MSKPLQKQSSLLGFFKKAPANTPRPAAASSATPSTPITPSTSHAGSSSTSEKSLKNGDVNAGPAAAGPAGIRNRASSASSACKHTIDLSSDGAIDDDVPSTIQDYASRGSSGGTAKSRLPNTAATSSASKPPAGDLSSHSNASSSPAATATKKKPAQPIPTPPLTSENESGFTSAASASEMDVDEDGDESEGGNIKRVSKSRTAKRQVILSDDEDDGSDAGASSDVPPKKKVKASKASKSKASKADSPFSLDEEESDEYSDGGIDWEEAASKSDMEQVKPKKKEVKSESKGGGKGGAPKRPAVKKSDSKSTSNSFLTYADLGKQERKEANANEGEAYIFLEPDRRMDADKNRPGDPNFDPRILYIPKQYESKFTPFEKQFWDIKRTHMDTVLFFQKGKFFELYETDAYIGHQVFDLKLTKRVKMSMVGVPEASIDYWTAKFLGQGFKVGRVDQAETAIGADLRRQDASNTKGKRKASNEPKIVHRELKTVLTTGTIVDGQLLTDDLSDHCVAIKEYLVDGDSDPKFGLVIADCSTANFVMSAFQDDTCRTRLETTIRQHKPRELICEKGNLSVPTLRLLRACVGPACTWNYLKPEIEFLNADDARKGLEELFKDAAVAAAKGDDGDVDEDVDVSDMIPEDVKQLYDNAEAMSAIGGMLWYLKGLNLDRDLVSVKNFNIFDPIRDGQALILDGQTLAHIEVLQNSSGTDEGTLFNLLCRCTTPFGKRLLKIWVCQPLRSVQAINDRLDAVEEIMQSQPFQDIFDRLTKGMPDVERLLSRIHAGNCRTKDFIKVLDAFSSTSDLFEKLADAASDFKSPSIPSVFRRAPELEKRVEAIRESFKLDGDDLKPVRGKNAEFDVIAKRVRQIETDLQDQLQEYRKELKCHDLAFKDIGTKDIYQIECPAKLKVPKSWVKVSGTQALHRYYSKEVEVMVQKLKEARERQDQAVKVFQYTVYKEFSRDYKEWLRAIKLVSELDCLVSLAKSSAAFGHPAVRPEIVDEPRASVEFDELRHPCIFSASSEFIPNTVTLGGSNKNMVLLTGPNMAGKSTLLRMTCVGVILAQIGCYVPAKRARISPCDRIVSRMGAADNMLAGQSTFRVEMEDCRKILVEATPRTLVILDELGRGTSTFDGLSIAYAVLHQLAGHLGCVGFFATHFTSLVEDFAHHPEVALKHLQTLVDDQTREVTFLYKLTNGSSPKSYGPHVASMAGVPRDVVERAIAVSQNFEERTKTYEASKKKDQALPLDLQGDASFLLKLIAKNEVASDPRLLHTLDIIRQKVTTLRLLQST